MPDPLVITAGAWAWDKYGKSLTDKAASALKGNWDKFKWNDASEKYRAKVKKLYGTMQIMGMAEPVPLDDIFTEAYLLDKPTAFSRFDIERLKQASADPDAPPPNAERVTGLSLVNSGNNLFILGKPGAGKTTFLKYIAVQAAEPDKPIIDKVPVFISLKQWSDSGKELLQFIEERFDNCDFPKARPFVEELLKAGGAIVLFDGLDEVNQEDGQRDDQTRAMNNFIEKYDRTQCLITCRLAASDYSFKPFIYVEIADFTPKQIETFVNNWFRNQEGEKDEGTSKQFLTEFKKDENKGLRDLARTPLLLTLLCLSFRETLTFPQRRVEIYKEALDALLKKWDSSRRIKRDDVYRKLSLGHKENMLARIAAETFEKNQYFIPQSELEKLIANFVKNIPPHDTDEAADGEAILKTIEAQHGIFVERAREVHSFSHLTFQEYFTAKYIVDNAAKGTLTNLAQEHCADSRWREVFLLTTSLLADASQFVKIFRREVEKLVKGDDKLRALLSWAHGKAHSTQDKCWLARRAYITLALYGDDYFVMTYFGYGLLSEIDVDDYLYGNPNFSLDLELNRCLTLAFERRFRARAIAVGDIVKNISHIHARAAQIAHDLGLTDLVKDLDSLTIPINTAFRSDWQRYAEKLRVISIKHRDVRESWELTASQRTQLNDYLNAGRLMTDCLKLAFMPPEEKEAMLNSLYLPPGQAGGVENGG
ncbi:MAG TPA: NACHT domain-containing protein [Pyrinomonadaceae bacterium]|jgi:hypothetical protein